MKSLFCFAPLTTSQSRELLVVAGVLNIAWRKLHYSLSVQISV